MEPQEVRDEKARELRKVFLDADSDAKAAEEAARQVRNTANERLKEAKAQLDAGTISQDEFNRIKKEVIAAI